MNFALEIIAPHARLFRGEVSSLSAEDRDGWFGVQPERAELVAVLPPGLCVARDAEGELFIAISGGLFHKRGRLGRLFCHDAAFSRDLALLSARVAELLAAREAGQSAEARVLDALLRKAERGLLRGAAP